MFSSDNGPHREGGSDPAFFKSSGPLRGVKFQLPDAYIKYYEDDDETRAMSALEMP